MCLGSPAKSWRLSGELLAGERVSLRQAVCRRRGVRFGLLERPLSRLCRRHATAVARRPWPFVVLPVLCTALLALGHARKRVENDVVRYYIPVNADSLSEKETLLGLFPEDQGLYVAARALNETGRVVVVVTSQDDGDVLRPAQRRATIRLNEFVVRDVGVRVDGRWRTYESVCARFLHFCHTNPQLYALDTMLREPGPFDSIGYPTAQRGQRRFYVANSLGGVTLDSDSGQVASARAWQLVYPMNASQLHFPVTRLLMAEMERQLRLYDDDLLTVSVIVAALPRVSPKPKTSIRVDFNLSPKLQLGSSYIQNLF